MGCRCRKAGGAGIKGKEIKVKKKLKKLEYCEIYLVVN